MNKQDYKLVTDATEIIKEYKETLDEFAELNFNIMAKKKEVNVEVSNMEDPLGSDFQLFNDNMAIFTNELDVLILTKKRLETKIIDLREKEHKLLEDIKKSKNCDAIMAKTMFDSEVKI